MTDSDDDVGPAPPPADAEAAESDDDVGPAPPPPPDGDGDDANAAAGGDDREEDVGPAPPPKAKKRKVGRIVSRLLLSSRSCGEWIDRKTSIKAPEKEVAILLKILQSASSFFANRHSLHTPQQQQQKSQLLAHEADYLASIPSASMYEKSYMHRETVTHVAFASPGSAGGGGGGGGGLGGGASAASTSSSSSSSTFLITASADGVVKFWSKKRSGGGAGGNSVVEFAKQYAAHSGPVSALAVSADGCLAATTGAADRTAKVFDVASFDMTAVIRLPFAPAANAADWISPPGARGAGSALLAVADAASGGVSVFDAASEDAAAASGARPLWHFPAPLGSPVSPVTCMRYNAWADCLVAADSRGMLDYFRAERGDRREEEEEGGGSGEGGNGNGDGDARRRRPLLEPRGLASWPPQPFTSFSLKSDSDLYALAKAKTKALSIEVSPDGRRFAVCCLDCRVRVFDFRTGKMLRCYDESPEAAAAMQRAASDALAAKVEKIMEAKEAAKEEAANGGGGGGDESTKKSDKDIEKVASDALAAASAGSAALEPIDFGRRLAAERELSLLLLSSGGGGSAAAGAAAADALPAAAVPVPVPQPAFDASGHFLAYGSLFGIKIVNLETNRLVRLLGKVESSERFLRLSLFQGGGGGGGGGSRAAARAAALAAGDDDENGDASITNKKKKKASASSFLLGDPTLAATAVGRARFFLFTTREPEDPEAAAARASEAAAAALSRGGAAAAAAAVADRKSVV